MYEFWFLFIFLNYIVIYVFFGLFYNCLIVWIIYHVCFLPSLGIKSWNYFPVGSVSLYLVKSWHVFVFSCNSNSIVIQLFYNEFQTFANQHVALFQNRRNGNVNDWETIDLPHCFSHHFTINFRYTLFCTSILFLYRIRAKDL